MSETKTFIIAWRFPNPEDKCYESDPQNGHIIIKFYTPDDKDEPIHENCFERLKKMLSDEHASNLYVLFHKSNFDPSYNGGKSLTEQLKALHNPQKNIYIEGFSSDRYILKTFIEPLKKDPNPNFDEDFFEKLKMYFEQKAIFAFCTQLWKILSYLKIKISNKSISDSEYRFELISHLNKVKNMKDMLPEERVEELVKIKNSLHEFEIENHSDKMEIFWNKHLKEQINAFHSV